MPAGEKLFKVNTSASCLPDSMGKTPNLSVNLGSKKEHAARLIGFVTIAEIIFADGSHYTSPETFESLKLHIAKIESMYLDN